MKIINDMKLYTTEEVREMLGTSYRFILTIIKRGELSASRIGRSYYISEEALTDYLKGKNSNR